MITTEMTIFEELRGEMHKSSLLAEKAIELYKIVNSTKRVAEVRNWHLGAQIFTITRLQGSDPSILANGVGFLGKRAYKHQLMQKLEDNPQFLTEELANCMGLAAIIEKNKEQKLLFGHLYSEKVFSTLISMVEYFGNRNYEFKEIVTSPLEGKFKQTPDLEKTRKLLSGISHNFNELTRRVESYSTMYTNKQGVILGNNNYHLWKND